MKTILPLALAIAALGLLMVAPVSADTIYGWKDEKGVQRFSNDPPPAAIKNFQKFQSQPSPAQDRSAAEAHRSSYNRMVQKASEEARQLEQQSEAQAAARAAEKKRLAEAHRKALIQAERSRLEKQIKAIDSRALGPNYTQGMKQAQIAKIKNRIDQLENKPEAAKTQQPKVASESSNGY